MSVNTAPALFRNRVRAHRKALRLTQAEVAERAGITRQTLIAIEKDDGYSPATDLALRLADALGSDVGVLFYSEAVA